MLHGLAREGVDPKPAGVKSPMRGAILAKISGANRFRRNFTGSKGIVDSFAGERLDDASCITDQEQTGPSWGKRGACERRDRTPGMIERNGELTFRPTFERG